MTADYNKTIIKEPRKREKKREKKMEKTKHGESASDAPPADRLHREMGERGCGRTGCVRGAYAN